MLPSDMVARPNSSPKRSLWSWYKSIHTEKNTIGQHWAGLLFAYVMLDLLMAVAGMGVPVFCILLGLPVGAMGARRAEYFLREIGPAMQRVVRYALVSSGITMFVMLGVWGRLIPACFGDVGQACYGIPLILFDPKASLVGWLVLMIIIAPFIQFVVTLASAYLTFQIRLRKGWGSFGS